MSIQQSPPRPCPFCGSSHVDPEGGLRQDRNGVTRHFPVCDDCGGSTESVERWNRRTETEGDRDITPGLRYSVGLREMSSDTAALAGRMFDQVIRDHVIRVSQGAPPLDEEIILNGQFLLHLDGCRVFTYLGKPLVAFPLDMWTPQMRDDDTIKWSLTYRSLV